MLMEISNHLLTETVTKYSAILFLNLGEYVFKFMNLPVTQILMITSNNNLLIEKQPKNIVP